jgi:2-keto-4-pentenoate hydratase/2-oxohepta-3-ene-1,7-dioic acid hydratase in catechol pathway
LSRFAKVKSGLEYSWGRIEGDSIILLRQAPWLGLEEKGNVVKLKMEDLVAPAEASKIVLVGLNYREHIKESQSANVAPEEPVIFMKPTSSIIGPNDEIPRYGFLERQDYEGELAAIVEKRLFRASESEIRDGIFGYTCLNDVTARALQKKDVQWTRAKGFDGFCPIGPWIVTDIDPTNLNIETKLNGETRQTGNSSEQIWDIFSLTGFISNVMTLLPGDIISTGTPQGVGNIKAGDVVEITIEKIGSLINKVKTA